MSKQSRKKSSKSASAGRKVPAKATGSRASSTAKTAKKRAASTGKSGGSAAKAAPRRPTSKRSAASESAGAASKVALAEGQKAPPFRLPRDGGGTATLSDYAGRKLVLFFYPRADTPGCTREAIDFTRLSGAFAESGTAVVGVSADPPKTQDKFRDKHKLAVPLVSDEKHEMLEAYGAWGEKSLYGRKFLGIIRTTVLVGADGRIARVWRNVRVDGHADDVLAAARNL